MESTTVFGRTSDVSGESRRAYSSNDNVDRILQSIFLLLRCPEQNEVFPNSLLLPR